MNLMNLRTSVLRFSALLRMAGSFLLWVGVWMMVSASVSYLELRMAHPFIRSRLSHGHPALWLTALCIHIPSALLSLPACLVLLSKRVRARFPEFHRWLGRVAFVLVVLGVVPSGLYLAFFARGGLITTLGFWLTGVLAFIAMLQSVQSARRRQMKAHRRWSTHVAAQLAVAVVSRFLLAGAVQVGLYRNWVYVAALWLPVIACALTAELLTDRRLFSNMKGNRHEELVVVSAVDDVR